jgi:GGDEF domain-containing protein
VGRYGPDEFLVIVTPDDDRPELTIEHVRCARRLSLQFDASERLPVTISADLHLPDHGESVTTLLLRVADARRGQVERR